MNYQAALKSYSNVHYETGVQDASSHRLIQMLLDGFLERVAQAKGAMQQKNIEMKGKKINDASSILMGLRDSLDHEQGGEISANLESLYDYVHRALLQAHLKNDVAKLEECSDLMKEVADSWRQIAS